MPSVIERFPVDPARDPAYWHSLRIQAITASDVPAVCGEGMFGSAAKVWAEKRGLLPPTEMNDAMRRGRWGEAAVVEALIDERPAWQLRRAKTFLFDRAARLGATPDCAALTPEREGITIIQAKVVAAMVFRQKWLDDPADDPHDLYAPATAPLAYQLQTLTESMLAEAVHGVIAALIVDEWRWTLRLFDVPRHPGAETMIRDRVSGFWTNYLDPGIQPPVDPARDSELMGLLYPQDEGTTIDLAGDNEIPGLVAVREGAKAAIKAAESVCEKADTSIKSKLGANTFGRLGDGRLVSWKRQERSGFTVEPTAFRVLRILKAKKS
jgi:predicted phage-related endonuclease